MQEERLNQNEVPWSEVKNGDAFVFPKSPETLRIKLGTREYATVPDFGTTYGATGSIGGFGPVIPQPQAKVVW